MVARRAADAALSPEITMVGAALGALAAHACGLYEYGAPQGYAAAAIGAGLTLIAYGGPVDAPIVAREVAEDLLVRYGASVEPVAGCWARARAQARLRLRGLADFVSSL